MQHEAPPQSAIDAVAGAIDSCMAADRRALRDGVDRARRLAREGKPFDRLLTRLQRRMESSRALRDRRLASLPAPHYPSELPVSARREEIRRAIEAHQVVIVCGETGSGKTTQLPKICLELGRGVSGAIGHTQPRRIAARSVAARIAHELQTPLGRQVGYKIRFTDETAPETLVKVMTDGVLLAETQGDRDLDRYDTIIIDEAHERSLNIDFLLGYLRNLLPKRPDLKVIVTSATIDPQRFSAHFADAPIIEVSGRTYPVEVRYRPFEDESGEATDEHLEGEDLEAAVVGAIDEACATGPGDILVFLSGEREIRDLAEALRDRRGAEALDILPLYARLGADEQSRVFSPSKRRRVVLATNIAETSLTVPGIRFVVDAGLARISRYSARSRVQRLPIEKISQASADQRKGRCGRIAPGVCFRLYSAEDFDSRPAFTDPEILRTNLAGAILQMKALGLGEIERFPFIDPPDRRLIRDGLDTLRELQAVDDKGKVTDIGRELARLPVDPRIGRMLQAARDGGVLREALIICAGLSIQDPRERPAEHRDKADLAHRRFAHDESDFLALLNVWRAFHKARTKQTRSGLRKWCATAWLSYPRMREWIETQRQLSEIVGDLGWSAGEHALAAHTARGEVDYGALHRALLAGLVAFVGRKREEGHAYDGPRGMTFHLFPGSGLFSQGPAWVMAAEIVQTTRLYARTAASVQPLWIEKAAGSLVRRSYIDPHWSRSRGRVMAYENVALWGLPLIERRVVHYGKINPEVGRSLFIQHALVDGEYDFAAPFLEHNKALEEEVRRLEAKARTQALLVDPRQRFDFYDARVPRGVYTAQQFEEWRRHTEKAKPTLLYMDRADLVQEAPEVTPESHPDEAEIAGSRSPLEYRLQPGQEEDGVTLSAPLSSLQSLDQRDLDWMVPGLIRERIIERIRALPKRVRTSFVPAPNFAKRCLEGMEKSGEPLDEAIARRLETLAGTTIPREVWATEPLPDHLRVNLRVLDERGRVLASGRDVRRLKHDLRDRLEQHLAALPDSAWNRDDVREWDFGELPESVQVQSGDALVAAYPALVEDGQRVHLRLLPSRERADAETARGVRRLAMIALRSELRWHADRLPGFERMALHYAPVGSAKDLKEDLLARLVERVYVADRPLPRTREEFEPRLDEGWRLLGPTADEVCGLVDNILLRRQSIATALEQAPASWRAVRDDLRRQVGALTAPGFVRSTPWKWLQQIPRYLAAGEERLNRLRHGAEDAAARDLALLANIERCEAALAERRARHEAEGVHDPNLEEFRWAIEEYRVSLFAQRLGTLQPMSAQRMEKLWAAVRP
jgi:ATP-dependent helicase HrpA